MAALPQVVPSYLDEIRELAAQFRPNERNLPLYFPDFDAPHDPTSLNRVFGSPVGITEQTWPQYPQLHDLLARADMLEQWDAGDLRMEHVFTLDLRDVRLLGAPADARAMQLFISNASFHGAYQNGNADTAVVFLSEEDVARGDYADDLPTRSLGRWSRRFGLERIDVPGDVFDPTDDDDSVMAQLHDAIWQAPARLGGCPIWLRDPQDPRDYTVAPPQSANGVGLTGTNNFLMQFEQRFADVNLGRQGVMYVSGVNAYYQSYE